MKRWARIVIYVAFCLLYFFIGLAVMLVLGTVNTVDIIALAIVAVPASAVIVKYIETRVQRKWGQ